jgi:hypothetical protein
MNQMRKHLLDRLEIRGMSASCATRCRRTIFAMCVCGVAAGAVASGAPLHTESHLVVLNHGVIHGRHWRVEVVGDGHRRGICLLVAADNGAHGQGESENAQCSAPAPRRGLVRSLVERRRSSSIILTAVGMAFSPRVSRVTVELSNGRTKELRLRRVKSSAGGPQPTHFRFVAFAVRGPWCVHELLTRNRSGKVLWAAPASQLVPYDPAEVCS